MPRKEARTLQHGYPVTPYHIGPKLIDDEGDSVTDPTADAVRVVGVSSAGENISDTLLKNTSNIKGALDEQLAELKRIRLGHELHLWEQEVPIE